MSAQDGDALDKAHKEASPAGERVEDIPLETRALLERIHEDALRVLEEVGVRCESPQVRDIFEDTGLAAFDETMGISTS